MGVGRGSGMLPDVTSRSHRGGAARLAVVSFRFSTIAERFPHRKVPAGQHSPLLICMLPPTLLIVPGALYLLVRHVVEGDRDWSHG